MYNEVKSVDTETHNERHPFEHCLDCIFRIYFTRETVSMEHPPYLYK